MDTILIYFGYFIITVLAIIWLLINRQEYKENKRSSIWFFIAMTVIILIMIVIVLTGNWLIDNDHEDVLYTIICFLVFWIIWSLYDKAYSKKEYLRLKTFSYLYIYKQKQKILSYDGDDVVDIRYDELEDDVDLEYSELDYEDELKKWVKTSKKV